jgi:F0F1-type ATP synthase assembly protein I
LNPLAALERSSNLNRGRYRTTVALMIVSTLIASVPAGVAMGWFVISDLPSGYDAWREQLCLSMLIVVAVTGLLMPFQGIVRAASYVQLRRDSPGAEGDLAQVFA